MPRFVSTDDVNESNQAHAINHLTLMNVLYAKGILSDDDDDLVDEARIIATHLVEQEWARKRDEHAATG